MPVIVTVAQHLLLAQWYCSEGAIITAAMICIRAGHLLKGD